MTTITQKDLAEELSNAWHDFGTDWSDVARTAAELLGVELADDKTEPGATGWHEDTRRPAFVDERGSWRVIMPNGEIAYVDDGHDFPVPARVVPAAPVALTEEQVGELWDSVRSDDHVCWSNFTEGAQALQTATVNAALAKHGGARELPGRDEVRQEAEYRIRTAVAYGIMRGKCAEPASQKWVESEITAATDRFTALLGGGDRG